MIGAVLSLVLTAQPNLFDRSEMSSEEITVRIDGCMAGVLKEDANASKIDAVVFCACAVDAIRFNAKSGLKPPKDEPTQAQLQRCHESILQRKETKAKEQKRGKAGT